MKARRNQVFLSSMLLTAGFLLLLPTVWSNAHSGVPFWHFGQAALDDRRLLNAMGPGLADAAVLLGESGIAGIAVIIAALVVIWKGYVKQVPWTWWVMLIIVWGWYFPFFMLPSLSHAKGLDEVRWLYHSRWTWIFALMLAGLLLPARSFLSRTNSR